jgi:hypothetical protein
MASPSMLLPDTAHATVTRVLRVAFPHPEFPDAPFERAATAILDGVAKDRRLQAQFAQGLRDLDTGSAPFVDLDDVAAFTTLEAMAGTAFFQSIRGSAVVGLYDDREVWELLGYEGPSFDKGGYLERGFDDLQWLPAPSVDKNMSDTNGAGR